MRVVIAVDVEYGLATGKVGENAVPVDG